MTRNRLYLLLGTAVMAGYVYLAWTLKQHQEHRGLSLCLFKNVTGIPCPSCGSTRSVLSLVKGKFFEAVVINPLGIIIAGLMLILPLWLLYDLLFTKDTLLRAYTQFEKALRIKWTAVLLIAFVIANWIWNIHKGL